MKEYRRKNREKLIIQHREQQKKYREKMKLKKSLLNNFREKGEESGISLC